MCKKYFILITKISVIVIMIIDAIEYRGNRWSQTSHPLPDQSYELKTDLFLSKKRRYWCSES